MAAVDAWNDNWESIADNSSTAKDSTKSTTSATAPASAAAVPSAEKANGAPTILIKKTAVEEDNRKIWEAAESTNAFEVLPSASAPPNKVIAYKPELKILKRAPPTAPTTTNTSASESPAIIDRRERERRYQEARERLFGPSSSTTSTTTESSNPSTPATPTAAMSRSSSASGLAVKAGESGAGSGASTPSKIGSAGRGGKKGGWGNNSGNSTPRNKSPGGRATPGERRDKGGSGRDPNRTSGIIGGITKVTDNGWVYTGTGQNSSGPTAGLKGSRVASPPGVAGLTTGMMGLAVGNQSLYPPPPPPPPPQQGNPYPIMGGAANPWSLGNGVTQRPLGGVQNVYTSGQNSFPQQQQFHSQNFPGGYQLQPAHQFPQYSGPPQFNTQAHNLQQPQKPPSHAGQPVNAHPPQQIYNINSGQQVSLAQLMSLQQRPGQSQPSPSHSSTSLQAESSIGGAGAGGATRTVYLTDPNAFTSRPPPPPQQQGSLAPGFGNHVSNSFAEGAGAAGGEQQIPIRNPKGPDMSRGNGFTRRGGRGG